MVGTRASRITRRARRASGTAGFIHSSLRPPSRSPRFSSPPSLPSRSSALPIRWGQPPNAKRAECPRNTFAGERPPVKTPKTRHYRISDPVILRLDSTRLDSTRRDPTRRLVVPLSGLCNNYPAPRPMGPKLLPSLGTPCCTTVIIAIPVHATDQRGK